MLWKVSCIKGNGQPRAQFLQWSVPKALRDALQLNDGDSCKIKVSLGNFDRTDSYQLTSGGEFRMAKDVAESLQEEINGNPNQEVSFELLIDGMLSKIADDFENQVRESVALNIDERQKRLSSAKSIPESYQAQVTLFRRNPDVVAEVLVQAKGVCQQCKQPAPFNRSKDKTPYLEVHHRKRLSEGGEDTVKNAIALCPNCHRKNHYG